MFPQEGAIKRNEWHDDISKVRWKTWRVSIISQYTAIQGVAGILEEGKVAIMWAGDRNQERCYLPSLAFPYCSLQTAYIYQCSQSAE